MKKLLLLFFIVNVVLMVNHINSQTVYYYEWDDESTSSTYVLGVGIDTVRITGDTIIMVYERSVVWDTSGKILVNHDDIIFWTDEVVTYDTDSFKISIDAGSESHYFFIPFNPEVAAFRITNLLDQLWYFCTCGQVNFSDPESWAWNINGCGNSFENGILDCQDLGTHCSQSIGCEGSYILGSLTPNNIQGGGIIIKSTYLASPGP